MIATTAGQKGERKVVLAQQKYILKKRVESSVTVQLSEGSRAK
jgi:hypothetical protein